MQDVYLAIHRVKTATAQELWISVPSARIRLRGFKQRLDQELAHAHVSLTAILGSLGALLTASLVIKLVMGAMEEGTQSAQSVGGMMQVISTISGRAIINALRLVPQTNIQMTQQKCVNLATLHVMAVLLRMSIAVPIASGLWGMSTIDGSQKRSALKLANPDSFRMNLRENVSNVMKPARSVQVMGIICALSARLMKKISTIG